MIYARITGTGGYLPDKVLTNHDLEKMVDTTDQWIRERTGICERRIARDDETTSTFAETACRRAIEAAGYEPGEPLPGLPAGWAVEKNARAGNVRYHLAVAGPARPSG